jgi:hypothetical protein
MTPYSLMQPNLADADRWGAEAPSWATRLQNQRVFRARGFTWFARNVGENSTALIQRIRAMEAFRRKLQEWNDKPFPWDENLAGAQINKARNGEPLRFDKAAKVVLVCEMAARDAGKTHWELLETMRLEPAVFHVVNFDKDLPAMIRSSKPGFDLVVQIANLTRQSFAVIRGMLEGKTVSYRLASMVRQALILSGIPTGPVAVKWHRPEPVEGELVTENSDPTDDEAKRMLALPPGKTVQAVGG